MKTIVAGSRECQSPKVVKEAMMGCDWDISEVVSGTARGVDQLGEAVAKSLGLPVARFPADWATLGKRAGYVRNEQMADYAQALCAIWDGKSAGTKNMIEIATRKGLKVHVVVYMDGIPS